MVTQSTTRKSHFMLLMEAQRGEPLEKLLPRKFEELGTFKAVADDLGIFPSTLHRWMQALGLRHERSIRS